MPWWLHRILMAVLILAGMLGGAYGMIWLPSVLKSAAGIRVGSWYVAVYALSVVLAGAIPWSIFRFLIPVKCPECGSRMFVEKKILPQQYGQQIKRPGTVYKCTQCRIEK